MNMQTLVPERTNGLFAVVGGIILVEDKTICQRQCRHTRHVPGDRRTANAIAQHVVGGLVPFVFA